MPINASIVTKSAKYSVGFNASTTCLFDPDVCGHDLILEIHVDQLGELQPQLHGELLGVVGHGAD